MGIKQIELTVAAPAPHMVGDGFRVHNFIPSVYRLDMLRMDPFIMLDYNSKMMFGPTDTPRGVGVHPHRGFETVTIAYKGKVAHHDSAGNSGIIGEGEVQWMTAASGILHKEYHEESFSKSGGLFQMVQLWINLPSKFKMTEPKYQAIDRSKIKSYNLPNSAGHIEVIAGNYKGIDGPAQTFTPLHAYNAHIEENCSSEFEFPAHYNTLLIVIEGEVTVNQSEKIETNHLVLFENKGEMFHIQALEKSCVLVLSGEPINEPIIANGPFVMNTKTELIQAFRDYHAGKFGYLED
jgi:redox-sensitive bicupin YhaK (pirin superfamily)